MARCVSWPRVPSPRDFDAAGTLYYQCGAAVMKAGGATVAQTVVDPAPCSTMAA